MKKNYKKPRVMFENLAFNTAIAACDFITTSGCQAIEGTSEIPYRDPWIPNTVYIINDQTVCTTEFYCYHINSNPLSDKIAGGS